MKGDVGGGDFSTDSEDGVEGRDAEILADTGCFEGREIYVSKRKTEWRVWHGIGTDGRRDLNLSCVRFLVHVYNGDVECCYQRSRRSET